MLGAAARSCGFKRLAAHMLDTVNVRYTVLGEDSATKRLICEDISVVLWDEGCPHTICSVQSAVESAKEERGKTRGKGRVEDNKRGAYLCDPYAPRSTAAAHLIAPQERFVVDIGSEGISTMQELDGSIATMRAPHLFQIPSPRLQRTSLLPIPRRQIPRRISSETTHVSDSEPEREARRLLEHSDSGFSSDIEPAPDPSGATGRPPFSAFSNTVLGTDPGTWNSLDKWPQAIEGDITEIRRDLRAQGLHKRDRNESQNDPAPSTPPRKRARVMRSHSLMAGTPEREEMGRSLHAENTSQPCISPFNYLLRLDTRLRGGGLVLSRLADDCEDDPALGPCCEDSGPGSRCGEGSRRGDAAEDPRCDACGSGDVDAADGPRCDNSGCLTIGRRLLTMRVFSIREKDLVPVAEQIFGPVRVVTQAVADLAHERYPKMIIINLCFVALSDKLRVRREEPDRLRFVEHMMGTSGEPIHRIPPEERAYTRYPAADAEMGDSLADARCYHLYQREAGGGRRRGGRGLAGCVGVRDEARVESEERAGEGGELGGEGGEEGGEGGWGRPSQLGWAAITALLVAAVAVLRNELRYPHLDRHPSITLDVVYDDDNAMCFRNHEKNHNCEDGKEDTFAGIANAQLAV
ncbi:hypothetical protein DFH09DRAFT_1098868 [Mycena vulgaris]|nr:hypothetical protein DFH09DRAFT_1098868 [Mycena vulgaris]